MNYATMMPIVKGSALYPSAMPAYMGFHAPEKIMARGNVGLLRHKLLALFCSVKCPGDFILQ